MIFKVDQVILLISSRLEISKAQVSRNSSSLLEKPPSRSGCTEASAGHGTTNECSESLSNTRGPDEVASSRCLFDPTSKPGLEALRSQSCPDLRSIHQAHVRAKKELGGESVEEKHTVGGRTEVAPENHGTGPDAGVTTDLAGDISVDHASEQKSNLAIEQNVHVVEHGETSNNEPPTNPQEPLPAPPTKVGMELKVSLQMVLSIRMKTQILSQKPLQTAPDFARAEKRIMETEDEELEAMVCRRTKRRIRTTTSSAQSAIIVERAKTLQCNLSFKPIPSRFHESS